MTTEYTPSGRERFEREREAGEHDDGSAYEPPGPTVNGTIPEHVRRERGQARLTWRTSAWLLAEFTDYANALGLTPGAALTRVVEEALGLDAEAKRLHPRAAKDDHG